MLNAQASNIISAGRGYLIATRDRVVSGLAGRSRQVVAIATLLGVTTIGLVAATLDNGTTSPQVPAAADTALRDAAAERANRGARPTESTPAPEASTAETSPEPPAETPAPPEAAPEVAAAQPAAPAAAWVHPMPSGALTSCYGQRWGVLHAGIDLAAPSGTEIHAVGAGTVVSTGWAYSGYGISVMVDHGDGYLTHYAHMSGEAVTAGQAVGPGTVLGYEGSTGDSTGPHLHFEVHAGMWNQIEPAQWLRDHGVDIGC